MIACIPDGLLFRSVDYRIVNPLFSGRRIKVYRQWIHGVDKDSDSPVTLDDLIDRTTPPKFQFQPEEVSTDIEVIPRPAHLRRQGRRARVKRMAIFWTATSDGTVGTIALVVLVPRPGKVFWKLHNEGYLLHRGDLESNESWDQTSDDNQEAEDKGDSTTRYDPKGYYYGSAEPFPRFDEMRGFDSLGRPVVSRTVSRQKLSTGRSQQLDHPWSLQDLDEGALEKERLERIKKAEALAKSRDLLRRLFDDEDEGFT